MKKHKQRRRHVEEGAHIQDHAVSAPRGKSLVLSPKYRPSFVCLSCPMHACHLASQSQCMSVCTPKQAHPTRSKQDGNYMDVIGI